MYYFENPVLSAVCFGLINLLNVYVQMMTKLQSIGVDLSLMPGYLKTGEKNCEGVENIFFFCVGTYCKVYLPHNDIMGVPLMEGGG